MNGVAPGKVTPLETMEDRTSDDISEEIPSSDVNTLRESLATGVGIAGIDHICRRERTLRR